MASTPKVIMEIVNKEKAANHAVAERLRLQHHPSMRAITKFFTENVRGAKIEFLGPLPNGSTVMRILANTKELTQEGKLLKAHVEINLSGKELMEYVQKKEFYQGLAALKLNQYTGYIAEQYIMNFARQGVLHDKMFFKVGGRATAKSFKSFSGKTILKDKVWAIQNKSGHGVDFLCEVIPTPPPPRWITLDSKATLRGGFTDYGTPKGPGLSAEQKNSFDNIVKHLKRATGDYPKPNSYNISMDEFLEYEKILKELQKRPGMHKGYVTTVGLEEGYRVASNKKYNTMMVIQEI
ncbi:TPA: hypothetical protein ACSTL1_002004 [Serratia fonticola]|uniref:hypothetical protein n=1 Tax=Serratia fonticola TaxID=47917 RepID=UPI00217BD95A|nr:hypothetical protein [Serratia fonticola]CAI1534720.1 Uncharacterised protein [Serratia fonticola]CAI1803585.1 Uncharacterised protein [Serratia fonticola]CAI1836686.1 Uncharacterised protein [Serratia fonticola]HBE9179928.1 hypothetical protein [Serratia fonticola]